VITKPFVSSAFAGVERERSLHELEPLGRQRVSKPSPLENGTAYFFENPSASRLGDRASSAFQP
jgi:hypothetical protein